MAVDSLIASVGIYAQQGKIEASNHRSLLATLYDAKAALERGNHAEYVRGTF